MVLNLGAYMLKIQASIMGWSSHGPCNFAAARSCRTLIKKPKICLESWLGRVNETKSFINKFPEAVLTRIEYFRLCVLSGYWCCAPAGLGAVQLRRGRPLIPQAGRTP